MKPPPMKPERWQQVEMLYLAGLERTTGQQAAYLAEACAGDEALRREVESLIHFHERAGTFIETPALEVAAQLQAESQRYSLVGRLIGHYQIFSLLGAGGMGEVYRALDTRLDREVAIKVLPPHLAQDPEALTRFKREAKAVAALSHPNILAIHDFGTEKGLSYAVMELLEGETLRGRVARSALPWREAVEVGIAVAEGLSAAHAKGMVHRDLKPENIFLTAAGQVKILDFGIARMKTAITADATTLTSAMANVTQPGRLLGTVGYMSPEQLRGEVADAPSDFFSFGVVFYEMLSGQRPFAHETAVETMAAVLKEEPPALSELGKGIPKDLDRVVGRCLLKQPGERFQSARDLASDLRAISNGTGTGQSPLIFKRPRFWQVVWMNLAAIVLLLGIQVWRYSAREQGKEIASLAVLPLVNASGDANTEYLSDGITENLINRLSQLPGTRVRARNTVFRYKGREADPQKVGRELRVDAVLMGRLIQRGNTVIISMELVNVADGSQLWSERSEQKFSDVPAQQEEIVKKILARLQPRLTGSEQGRLSKRYTDNTEANLLYLKGLYFWNKRNEAAIRKGIEYFQQALEKDRNYALAYAGLAESYAILPTYGDTPPEEAALNAKAAALQALEIDPTLAEAQATLGSVSADQWDWPEAEKRLKRALELNPGNATAHGWYADYLTRVGRVDEGLAEIKRAYELDPLSLPINLGFASILFCARQYDRAIEQARKTLELEPSFIRGRVHMGLFLLQVQRYEEAIAELDRAKLLSAGHSSVLGPLGYAYAVSGRKNEARKILRELTMRAKQRHVPAIDLAVIYLGLGEKDRTFALLNRACEERSGLVTLLKVEPPFDPLRSDPRFPGLLRRVGLSQ